MADISFDDLIPSGGRPGAQPEAPRPGAGLDFTDLVPPSNADKKVKYRGAILPFTQYEDGTWDNLDFANSGITGKAWHAMNALQHPMTQRDPETGLARTSDETIQNATEAAGLGGARVVPGARSAGVGASRPSQPPTAPELLARGGEQKNQARALGVEYDPAAVANIARQVQQDLYNDGITPHHAPKVYSTLNDLANPPEGAVSVPLSGVDAARKALSPRGYSDDMEREAARRAQKVIDGVITRPDPGSVLAGDAAQAGKLFSDGNANYAAGKRSEKISGENYSHGLGISEKAAMRNEAAYTGENLDNMLRRNVNGLLQNKQQVAGYSEEELAALRAFVAGDTSRNVMRKVGSLLGGMKMGTAASLGAGSLGQQATGSLWGAAAGAVPPAVAMAANAGRGRMAQKSLDAVDLLIRSRSPMAQQMPRVVDPGAARLPPGLLGILPPGDDNGR